ncbi:hypothetical protein RRG08_005706 [Elysia crispata]|uniref:Uncharacterized protein n=1 Tax=Elysia crispata TaxID=231223 RepID=A0AAE1CX38_9GAST|nr:hypothetical protein RRG08_005706 [Elysia crispata]
MFDQSLISFDAPSSVILALKLRNRKGKNQSAASQSNFDFLTQDLATRGETRADGLPGQDGTAQPPGPLSSLALISPALLEFPLSQQSRKVQKPQKLGQLTDWPRTAGFRARRIQDEDPLRSVSLVGGIELGIDLSGWDQAGGRSAEIRQHTSNALEKKNKSINGLFIKDIFRNI